MIPRRRRKKPTPSYKRDKETDDVNVIPRERLLQLEPSTCEGIDPFAALHINLAAATELYEHHGDGGRAGVHKAMIDVVGYLSARGISRATLTPILAVAIAIQDAEEGNESRIFKPNRKSQGGTPPNSLDALQTQAFMAVIMECCVRQFKAEGYWPFLKPASQKAASLVRESNWPFSPTATNMRECREAVKSASKHSPNRNLFEVLMEKGAAESRPLEFAKALLMQETIIHPPA